MSGLMIQRNFGARCTWAEMDREIRDGNDGFISLHDTISFQCKNGTEIKAEAVMLNPYWDNSVAFLMTACLPDPRRMNARNTNRGGWAASELHTFANEDFASQVPDELLEIVKPRLIRQNVGGVICQSEDKFWAPSVKEICGIDNDCDIDDVSFPVLDTKMSRVRAVGGVPYYWWLRSAYGGAGFYSVGSNGGSSYYAASAASGVVFGFLI